MPLTEMYLTRDEYDQLPQSEKASIRAAPRPGRPRWVMLEEDTAQRIREGRDQGFVAVHPADDPIVAHTTAPRPPLTARGVFLAVLFAVTIATSLVVYGPVLACHSHGGEPMMNTYGAEWCDINGDRIPTDGDRSLNW